MTDLFFEKNRVVRAVSLLLSLLLIIISFSGCSSSATTSVGKVSKYDVPYDEMYFLAQSYKSNLEAKYGEYDKLDPVAAEQFEKELEELVYSNITVNYAILSLCEEYGLSINDDGIDDRVDEYIDNIILTDFASDKSAYKESLKQFGFTEHYVRFTAAVDILYSDLLTKLLEASLIEDDDEKIKEIVKSEFARTWHIMISNDSGESIEANRAKAEEALEKYRKGEKSMYELIGSVYNEDLSLTELDGFYFAKGSMDEKYEEAAFALEVGEISDVVETYGTNSLGQTVTAFYLIKRLEIEDEYVDKNLSELKQKYIDSVVYEMLDEKKSILSFEPNEFAKELELSTLKAPSNMGTVIVVSAAVIVVLAAGVVFMLVAKKRRSRALVKK